MPRVLRGSRTPHAIRTGRAFVLLSAFALLGASCSGGSAPPPKPVDASAYPTRWPIKHVIYIIKENRTFDQFFGLYPGANGATRGRTKSGMRVLEQGIPDNLVHDIKHDHTTASIAYDHGQMDGFAWDKWSDRYAYSVAKPRDIPNYWHWAKRFVLADNFFSSQRG